MKTSINILMQLLKCTDRTINERSDNLKAYFVIELDFKKQKQDLYN